MSRPLRIFGKLSLFLLIIAHLIFIVLLFSPTKFLLALSDKNTELVQVQSIPDQAQDLLFIAQEELDTNLNQSQGILNFFKNAPLKVRRKIFMDKEEKLAVDLSLTQFSPELVGMQAGADYYFQKPLNELSEDEWILLMNFHLIFQN